MGNGGTDPLILEFGTRLEMSGQLHVTAVLLPAEYINGWAPEPRWSFWRRENF